EFAILAGLHGFDPNDDVPIADYARRISPRLLLTLGVQGAALVSEAGVVERLPAIPVRAIDTTGAGDAFVGAFAVGLAAGLNERAAVRLGIACASDSVTRHGTQSSFASREAAAGILEEIRSEA